MLFSFPEVGRVSAFNAYFGVFTDLISLCYECLLADIYMLRVVTKFIGGSTRIYPFLDALYICIGVLFFFSYTPVLLYYFCFSVIIGVLHFPFFEPDA